jgi:hypothetical protein
MPDTNAHHKVAYRSLLLLFALLAHRPHKSVDTFNLADFIVG